MSSRAAFLARLQPAPAAVLPVDIPEVRYDGVTQDDLQRRWEALGGSMHRVPAHGLAELVQSITQGRGPVLVASDPLVADLHADLRWPACGVAGAAAAEVAVIGGVAAVAATASVVLDSRVASGRAGGLLAPAAVFVVRQDDVVSTPADILRQVDRRWPDGLPSQLVFVSGPSRSADIEMTLTRGVHGPGEVHLILLDRR